MATRLIINADDFGLTHGINRAVAELHRAGVLTSATLMATGPAFEDAITIARSMPSLGVGCHIVLVDGVPASSPDKIPSLLGTDCRRFRPSLLEFVRDLHLGRIRPAEIAYEAEAQMRKLQQAGIDVTHVDTHKHTHLFPAVLRALRSVSSIRALRNPFEPRFARKLSSTHLKRRLQIALLDFLHPSFNRTVMPLTTTDGAIGVSATGTLNMATLREMLNNLPKEGTFELVCHPGYNDSDLDRVTTRLREHRNVEREALLAEIPHRLAAAHPPELIHFGQLVADAMVNPFPYSAKKELL